MLVTALTLAVVVALTPGIDVRSPSPQLPLGVVYVVLGLVYGLLHEVIRPVIVLFTARFLLVSIPVYVVTLNSVLFWLLVTFLQPAFAVATPAWLWILLISSVLLLALPVMEAVFGLDSPVISDVPQTRFYWRWLGWLGSGGRNRVVENLRVAQISQLIIRYTKDVAIDLTPLARFRLLMQQLLYPGKQTLSAETTPAKVRLLLQELGPTFVKCGQMMASRAEVLPKDWRAEFERLQSDVAPFPYEEAARIVQRELDQSPEAAFASFDHESFAAASTAQVHRATLVDGTPVVVKVQRPDIDVTVRAELNVMRDLAAKVQRRRTWAREADLSGVVNEFASNIALELNYENELLNMRMLTINMSTFPTIHIPLAYPELSGRHILTQEFVRGVKITDVSEITAAGINLPALATEFLRAMLQQILIDGFFHADPHPGNVLVNLDTGTIVFIDMGLMGSLTSEHRMALIDLLWGINDRDGYDLAKTIMRLSTPFKRQVNEGAFIADLERLMKRYQLFADQSSNLSGVLADTFEAMRRAGLRLQSDLTLALKALVQAEEIVHTLDPSRDLVVAAFAEVKDLLRKELDADTVMRLVRQQVVRTGKELVRRIPSLERCSAQMGRAVRAWAVKLAHRYQRAGARGR